MLPSHADATPFPSTTTPDLRLGIPGFTFADLFVPKRLSDLFAAFLEDLDRRDPGTALRYREILEKGEPTREDESWLTVVVGPHVAGFLSTLFGLDGARTTLVEGTRALDVLVRVRKEFTKRRVAKRAADATVDAMDPADIGRAAEVLCKALGSRKSGEHEEFAFARTVAKLLDLDAALAAEIAGKGAAGQIDVAAALAACDPAFAGAADAAAKRKAVDAALDRLALFGAWHRRHHPHGSVARGWVTFRLQETFVFDRLVPHARPRTDLPEYLNGFEDGFRRRDGFALTDTRMESREIAGEIDTCIFCHERDKDSCSKGLVEKGEIKKNPLGIALDGCPLDEHISEAHVLRAKGDAIAALATIMINNPMLPGTGHRICNDCMKACIYQKQEPVNIPQIETSILTDVLAMPYGPEVYGLLTRWNPLNIRRPYQLPLNGRKILVVGLGPAGYTLAHYLVNEGFGVVAIDGLKLEPLEPEVAGRGFVPMRAWSGVNEHLGERIARGFGGVSEYGITVRWDKNFLFLLYATLARRQGLRMFGGIRFGGTLELEDAAELGFDHVAVATGAGKPTVVDMKNNLIRGVRKASDFLMALQLTGATRDTSLANLMVRLPAVVIGGGLTAIDTATELLAYYPLLCERVAARTALLRAEGRFDAYVARLTSEEKADQDELLAHAALYRAERERALAAGEEPDLVSITRRLGGVTICYRKSLQDSPAYRLNHEEVVKALEEGIGFIENVSPTECLAASDGSVRAVRFTRAVKGEDGKSLETEIPARAVMVAAGTSPNTIYERERPGTFKMQPKGGFFAPFTATFDGGAVTLGEGPASESFFTSYTKDGLTVSYYGDNHPAYAGNVVKAMASARNGYRKVVDLFGSRIRHLEPSGQGAREQSFRDVCARLDRDLRARVVKVERLTPTIVEVVLHAPYQARKFQPGQFYRLQDFETQAELVHGIRLAMEGLALTGAWTDPEKGLLSLIILEMGGSSNLCARLKIGQEVVCMGPTGAPTEIPRGEKVVLAGGGLGNAVLFSIAKALKDNGCRVVYFAGYKSGSDLFKQDEVEASTDQVIFSTDSGPELVPRRPQDRHVRANIVQAMLRWAKGELGPQVFPMQEADRIIAIGSDRMMAAVKAARHDATTLGPYMKKGHHAVGSINSPMQCMMKEVCAQCLQRHVDPETGKETFVFSCFNQDQDLDRVDFGHLNTRLKQNTLLEKLAAATIGLLVDTVDAKV